MGAFFDYHRGGSTINTKTRSSWFYGQHVNPRRNHRRAMIALFGGIRQFKRLQRANRAEVPRA